VQVRAPLEIRRILAAVAASFCCEQRVGYLYFLRGQNSHFCCHSFDLTGDFAAWPDSCEHSLQELPTNSEGKPTK
jgi:hypothetical protein